MENKEYIVDKRPAVKKSAEIILWTKSAGRCAICNKYLLNILYDVSTGEMAHIVGWKKTSKSPRGENELPSEQRNDPENLMLLCAEHHKIIDTPSLSNEFTVEKLIEIKLKHEERILHLTSLKPQSETVVIRILGVIRGTPVEVSKEHVRDVIFTSEGKYPMYKDSFDSHGVEINLQNIGDPEEWESYWNAGKAIIDKSMRRYIDGISSGEIKHISVFALARIPLLIYFGFLLDDKIPTAIYQKQRGDSESWKWDESSEVYDFEYAIIQQGLNEKVAVLNSISGTIDIRNIREHIPEDYTVYEIKPKGIAPNREILRSRISHKKYCDSFQMLLSDIERNNKSCSNITMFNAIPASAAISIGRIIMKNVHPSFTIYDYDKEGYRPTLKIN